MHISQSSAKLAEEIAKLAKGNLKKRIDHRLASFRSFRNKTSKSWFSELCFCILTANSKGRTAYSIQKELGAKGFCECSAGDIRKCIQKHKHRFHNNKTKFIVEARQHIDIKQKIESIITASDTKSARIWLNDNIKGLGYKESSHFLRNVGYQNLAIIDRHVMRVLEGFGIIKAKQSLSVKDYILIERKLQKISDKLKMTQAELDMYLWYMRTGDVLK